MLCPKTISKVRSTEIRRNITVQDCKINFIYLKLFFLKKKAIANGNKIKRIKPILLERETSKSVEKNKLIKI